MEENELLAEAIGWEKDQIETVDGVTYIVIGDERHRFDFNDPLVIEPIREKYQPQVIELAADSVWANVPGSELRVGSSVAEAIARAVIASEGLA